MNGKSQCFPQQNVARVEDGERKSGGSALRDAVEEDVDGLVVAAAAAGAVVAHVLDHLTMRLEFSAPLPENIDVFHPSSLKLMPVSPNTSYGHLHPLRSVGLLLEVDAVHHVLDACAPRPSERARDTLAEVHVHAEWRLGGERCG